MAVDCSVAVNFLREYHRMCESRCTECPLSGANNGTKLACDEFKKVYPEKAVKIVQKWSDEHPQKTRLDDLLEKYPKAILTDGTPYFYPYTLGYCDNCKTCSIADKKYIECWNEPLDGGATGKAVE